MIKTFIAILSHQKLRYSQKTKETKIKNFCKQFLFVGCRSYEKLDLEVEKSPQRPRTAILCIETLYFPSLWEIIFFPSKNLFLAHMFSPYPRGAYSCLDGHDVWLHGSLLLSLLLQLSAHKSYQACSLYQLLFRTIFEGCPPPLPSWI